MQPHRYTRLSALFEAFCTCFNDADSVIVAPVYAGRRSCRSPAPIATAWWPACGRGATATSFRSKARSTWRADRNIAQPGDYVVCLGAGSITQWAYALPGELAALDAAA